MATTVIVDGLDLMHGLLVDDAATGMVMWMYLFAQ